MTTPKASVFQLALRGDTQQRWLDFDPVLAERELVLETTSNRLKLGDGTSKYSELPYVEIGGPPGEKGWAPELAVIEDGERRVAQVVDWVGGEGIKPPAGDYLGSGGLVSDIAQAVNFRGPTGPIGVGVPDPVSESADQTPVTDGNDGYELRAWHAQNTDTALDFGGPNEVTAAAAADAVAKAHDQNTDTALAEGTADEVTAGEARGFLDAIATKLNQSVIYTDDMLLAYDFNKPEGAFSGANAVPLIGSPPTQENGVIVSGGKLRLEQEAPTVWDVNRKNFTVETSFFTPATIGGSPLERLFIKYVDSDNFVELNFRDQTIQPRLRTTIDGVPTTVATGNTSGFEVGSHARIAVSYNRGRIIVYEKNLLRVVLDHTLGSSDQEVFNGLTSFAMENNSFPGRRALYDYLIVRGHINEK